MLAPYRQGEPVTRASAFLKPRRSTFSIGLQVFCRFFDESAVFFDETAGEKVQERSLGPLPDRLND